MWCASVNRRPQPGNRHPLSLASIARRSLQRTCLGYLMTLDDAEVQELCLDQFRTADNMTEVIAALANLCHHGAPGFVEALAQFYESWRHDPLVIDKWFSIQATSPRPGALDTVRDLMTHPAFSIKNPNKVRALIGAFCNQNRIHFHAADGTGYAFLADQVISLDNRVPG